MLLRLTGSAAPNLMYLVVSGQIMILTARHIQITF